MFFSLEFLKAKKGDALLVHFGTKQDPTLIVVDGGPSGVYRRSLEKRLLKLRGVRAPGESLPIRLMMVSHIDDDHIKGILDLTKRLREEKKDKKTRAYAVQTLWHNAFDDVVGNHADLLVSAAQNQIGEAAVTGEFYPDLDLENPEAAMVIASVPQGRTLRDDAKLLDFAVNDPFDKLIMAPGDGSVIDPPIAKGLEVQIIGPSKHRVVKFQEEWDKELKKKGLDKPAEIDVAAYLDRSIWNLASIVVLLRVGSKEMLLTGDGRGDDILAGMEEAGLFTDGKRHLDLLKLPHHGSSNNVELDFFRKITADHYVISGDGSHGNPNVETFDMLFEARCDDQQSFRIYLTYPPEEFTEFHNEPYPLEELNKLIDKEKASGREFEMVALKEDKISGRIDLLDQFET